jgi:hypothetical protein
VATPGVFWVSMDDTGARWSGAAVSGSDHGVLRFERRDHEGHLLWSGAWTYRGTYDFSAAVTPGGELIFAATAPCAGADPACGSSLFIDGEERGSIVVKLGTDHSTRWIRLLSGRLLGADVQGGTALGWSRPTASAPYVVVRLDAGGSSTWSRAITSVVALHLDRTGDVLATGCYQDDAFLLAGVPCRNGVVAAKLGPDGAVLWTNHVDGFWPGISSALDGTEYAAAWGGSPFVLTSLSPDGALRWSRTFGGNLLANQRGDALLVAAAADGPVAIAGYAYDHGDPLPVLLGYDAAGSATFTREVPGAHTAVDMVFGRDGEILLAVPGGAVDAPGGHVEGGMILDLAP